MSYLVSFGETLMRLGPSNLERLCQQAQFDINFVGAEVNVAVSMARYGHKTAYVAGLPSNSLGRAARDEIRKHGVGCDDIHFQNGRMGLLYLEMGAMFRPSQILYDREHSAFAEAAASEYDWDTILDGADWLHLSGISLALGDAPRQACFDAVAAAKKHGVKISFDCNYRPTLWEGREVEAPELLKEILASADILFGGPRDMALIFDREINLNDPKTAFANASMIAFEEFPNLQTMAATSRKILTADNNIITAFISDGKSIFTAAPIHLDNIVDRIGTGDAFVGGILHRLSQERSLQDTIDFGLAACSIKHSLRGDFNLTSEAEVENFINTGASDVSR